LIVEAAIADQADSSPGEILLFVRDGRLSYLEYVWFGDSPPSVWPRVTGIVSTGVRRF
jgi:hypothetical protein